MSAILTPALSKKAQVILRQEQVDRYRKQGFTRENYEYEIVVGCKLPWQHYKAKAFSLSCYREETGIRPDSKNGNGDREVKPLVVVNLQVNRNEAEQLVREATASPGEHGRADPGDNSHAHPILKGEKQSQGHKRSRK